MIEALRIERLAVVEEAELRFGPGLNVLTGETGAGKSIVLGALSLLAGGRATPDAVRAGAEDARVEAVFRTEALPGLEAELAARGLEGDPHALVVSRTVARAGRGRARVNGQVVPVATLAELFEGQLEVSSQHESQALRRPGSHGRLLDAFGNLGARRQAVLEGVQGLRALHDEIGALRSAAEDRARREDFLRFQVEEIAAAELEPGEYARLGAERARLAHAERLGEDASAALGAIEGDAAAPDTPGAADQLGHAARALDAVARVDDEASTLAARARALELELRDVGTELARYAERIELDPARLARVEARLAQVEALRRKYGEDEEAILAFHDRTAAELAAVAGADERLAKLEAERAAADAALRAAARKLSDGRRRAGRKLAKAVESALAELALDGARFEVALPAAEPLPGLPGGPNGAEAPEFRFAANAGEEPRALRKVASGGELSRVFLAAKNVLRSTDAGMVLVFDEVDAGIGGRVADRVGRVLAELAGAHQVLCISHLPQIAALAETHFRVAKRDAGGRTFTEVTRLGEEERVEEIARMAGGAEVSAATRRHARDLLRGGSTS